MKVEIESLQGADFDLSLTGFDETELAGFFDTADDAKKMILMLKKNSKSYNHKKR